MMLQFTAFQKSGDIMPDDMLIEADYVVAVINDEVDGHPVAVIRLLNAIYIVRDPHRDVMCRIKEAKDGF